MIRSFADRDTQRLFQGAWPRRIPAELARMATRKLIALDAATRLADLRSPPGNHLELLGGNRKGQYSIRVNAQWRICFRWTDDGAHDVEFTDYH
jgi:proteic killer suppression protein